MHAYDKVFINGQWVASAGTGTLSVTNSATEEVIATVPEGTARLRIALSALHTPADIDLLVRALTELSY